MPVLHRQIYKPSAFGGVTNSTLCNRVHAGQDMNVADRDSEVTCFYCRQILNGERKSPRTRWLTWTPPVEAV